MRDEGDLIILDDSKYRKSEIVHGSFFFSSGSGIWVDWVVFVIRFFSSRFFLDWVDWRFLVHLGLGMVGRLNFSFLRFFF